MSGSGGPDRHPDYRIARPARLGGAVVAVLLDRIAGGEFPPGATLPPEPDLAREFGVSRTVIREALKRVEEKGVARIQQGRGTTVLAPDRWNVLDDEVLSALLRHDSGFDILADLVHVRVAVESGMAALAARQVTDDQLRRLRAVLERMDELVDSPEQYAPMEHQFHTLIVEASGNLVGRSVIAAIGTHLRLDGRRRRIGPAQRIRDLHPGHHEIFRQIARHDPAGTAQAVADHVRTSWSWVERERAGRRRAGTDADAE